MKLDTDPGNILSSNSRSVSPRSKKARNSECKEDISFIEIDESMKMDIPNGNQSHEVQPFVDALDKKVDENERPETILDNLQINLNKSENNDIELPYPPTSDVLIVKELKQKSIQEITSIAQDYSIHGANRMLRSEMIAQILRQAALQDRLIYSEGVLEIVNDGHGFLRSESVNYAHCPDDVFLSSNQIRKFGLRYGDMVSGYIRAPRKGEKNFILIKLMEINGKNIDIVGGKINFENLTPLYPNKKLNLEMPSPTKDSVSTRIIDLISPIGKGQRALIVAPPRSGKTMLIQNIAHAITLNHPEVYLIVLLIDERPEEVTDMKRTVKGEVISSTFDEPASRHVALSEIVIEKAKRLVEDGKDVVLLLDNITRLARAYNTVAPSSGKILSGGVDSNALQRPKRFLGAARNTENGGSLTIIATSLIETGSRMDEVIFEEFKGTGNCEIVLDRKIAERRIFPAIDVLKSGTRKEEELVGNEKLTRMWMLRRILTGMGATHDSIEFLIKKLKDTKTNDEFLSKMNTISSS